MSDIDEVEVKHALSNMASLLTSFYKDLREQGMPRSEALALTLEWMRMTMGGNA